MTKDLYELIHARPEINWSQVARAAFEALLERRIELVMTPDGPVLRTAPGEAEPKTEKRKNS